MNNRLERQYKKDKINLIYTIPLISVSWTWNWLQEIMPWYLVLELERPTVVSYTTLIPRLLFIWEEWSGFFFHIETIQAGRCSWYKLNEDEIAGLITLMFVSAFL